MKKIIFLLAILLNLTGMSLFAQAGYSFQRDGQLINDREINEAFGSDNIFTEIKEPSSSSSIFYAPGGGGIDTGDETGENDLDGSRNDALIGDGSYVLLSLALVYILLMGIRWRRKISISKNKD
jgi:hypothetical protein